MTEFVPAWPGTPVQAIWGAVSLSGSPGGMLATSCGADQVVCPSICWKNQMLPLVSWEMICTDVAVTVIDGNPIEAPPSAAEVSTLCACQLAAPGTCS